MQREKLAQKKKHSSPVENLLSGPEKNKKIPTASFLFFFKAESQTKSDFCHF